MKKSRPSHSSYRNLASTLRAAPLRELSSNAQTLRKSDDSSKTQRRPHTKRREFAFGISLSFFALVCTLGVIEIGFRLVSTVGTPPETWSDRPLAYYLPDDAPTLQDFSYPKNKESGTFRMITIGDSFTFAPQMQFDDAYPKRLERMLNLKSGRSSVNQTAEVINFGVPGYSTHHEVLEVKKALKYEPDLILLQITLNDVQEKPYTPTGLRRTHEFGAFHSELPLLKAWRSLEFVLRRIHNQGTHKRYVDYYFDLFGSETNWKSFQSGIASISRRVRKKNVPIVAVIFPLFGLPLNEDYPFLPLHEKTSLVLQKFDIPVLDLFETFRGLPLDRLQLIPGVDFHPNEIAHRIAAEAIYPWLNKEGFVPQSLITDAVYPGRIDILGRMGLEPAVK